MDPHAVQHALPPEVLVRILQQVDQKQRLRSCSSVSHAWQAAAAAATTDVSLHLRKSRSYDVRCCENCSPETKKAKLAEMSLADVRITGSFLKWLAVHGAGVHMLDMFGQGRISLALPSEQLQQLRHLRINGCKVELSEQQQQQLGHGIADAGGTIDRDDAVPRTAAEGGSSSSAAGSSSSIRSSLNINPLSHLTQLTALELEQADITSSSGNLQALAALSNLQLLRMPKVTSEHLWITQLQQLTQLEVDPSALSYRTPAAFSGMQQLQQLVFSGLPVFYPELLSSLPPSLTRLEMDWVGDGPLCTVKAPALAILTAMQHLDLTSSRYNAGISPDFLSSMPQLRVVKLGGLHREALLVLLNNMSFLTRLEELELARHMHVVQPLPEGQHAQYSLVLPPSRVLRRVSILGLEGCPMLPAGCAALLFPPGQTWPALRELVLSHEPNSRFCLEEEILELMPQLFGPGDISRLVACCPNLESLWIPGTVQPGVDLSPLLQLAGLTQLGLAGQVVADDVSFNVLQRLPALEHLEVWGAEGLTDDSLLGLTCLRQLTSLEMWGCGFAEQRRYRVDGTVSLTSTGSGPVEQQYAELAGAPDVWQQLLQLCITSGVCCPRIVAALEAAEAAELQQQQQQQQQLDQPEVAQLPAAALLQQQLAAAQQQVAQLQQQLAAEQERATAAEALLAAAQAAAASW